MNFDYAFDVANTQIVAKRPKKTGRSEEVWVLHFYCSVVRSIYWRCEYYKLLYFYYIIHV